MPILTEVQKARIIVKLDELKKEKTELARKLSWEKESNMAAAITYGSELSASSMIAAEEAIAYKITEVDEKIRLLRNYLNGDTFVHAEASLLTNLVQIENQIKTNEKAKKDIEESLSKVLLLKKLLEESGVKV